MMGKFTLYKVTFRFGCQDDVDIDYAISSGLEEMESEGLIFTNAEDEGIPYDIEPIGVIEIEKAI